MWPKKVNAIKRRTIRQRTQVGLVVGAEVSKGLEAFMKNRGWIP
jgi:hypothetical protein